MNIGASVGSIACSYRKETTEDLSKALIPPKGDFILLTFAVPAATVK